VTVREGLKKKVTWYFDTVSAQRDTIPDNIMSYETLIVSYMRAKKKNDFYKRLYFGVPVTEGVPEKTSDRFLESKVSFKARVILKFQVHGLHYLSPKD
jgi:hypothetical protein